MSVDASSVTGGRLPDIQYAGIGDEAAPDLAGQLDALRRLGWRSIELRTVDGTAIADLDDRAFARLSSGLDAAGADVVCVDSRIANWARPITGRFEDDLDELRILARRCATLGTQYVRVMSYPNSGLSEADWGRRTLRRMTTLVQQAEQYGLVLLHENCSGWAGTRADRMLDLLHHIGSPALRLLFDIGNGVPYGYDARAVLDAVIEHVAHVHVKDARPRAGSQVDDAYGAGEVEYTLPGEGDSGVRECLTALLRHGYTGAWSIEPHTHLRPHDDHNTTDDDGVAAFVRYGRSLERLVQLVQLEVAAGSVVTADDGGARA
ncbi:sugar phosphate isomerase/epimerase family protein [Streptomyces sp. NPDC050315]|uniref:sugar phosphate isomerase/epimerase family protein n=1 Tax=Streptomyces sp. NPDC050315 TaxID=3155039 RepID=UPI00343B0DA0